MIDPIVRYQSAIHLYLQQRKKGALTPSQDLWWQATLTAAWLALSALERQAVAGNRASVVTLG